MIQSTTTQNVAVGTVAGGGGIAGVLVFIRTTWPEALPWPVEADASLLITVGTIIIPVLSRWLAFFRDPSKTLRSAAVPKNYHRMLPFFLAAGLGLGLAGCATNGISVMEQTAAGDLLEVKQHTVSTMFAKTQEGAGNFAYRANGGDGSSFDMSAGAGVVGQDGGDPTALVLGVLNAIAPLMAAQAQAQAATPPVITDDRLEQILVMLEVLVNGR